MEHQEFYYELSLPYSRLVSYLQDKYGMANGNYFLTPACASKNKRIMRSEEGLFCHHVKEDVEGDLSKQLVAKQAPYEWQCSKNLVYCNYLEHLILHVKIGVIQTTRRLSKPINLLSLLTQGASYICNYVNDLFMVPYENLSTLQKNYFNPIQDNYNDYLFLLRLIMYYTIHKYSGADKTEIESDGTVEAEGMKYRVQRNKRYEMGFRDTNDRIITVDFFGKQQPERLVYLHWLNELRKGLSAMSVSKNENGCSDQIYKELLQIPESKSLTQYAELLDQDFQGYKDD